MSVKDSLMHAGFSRRAAEAISAAVGAAGTTLTKAAVGLGLVDNTSDLTKPLSTATTAALIFKQNIAELDAAMATKVVGPGATASALTAAFVGQVGGSAITTGIRGDAHSVAIGSGALSMAAAGTNQTAVGYRALNAAVDDGSGIQNGANVAVGDYALEVCISNQNTAVGSQTLQSLVGTTTTGISNCAFGDQALNKNVSGNSNVAVGVQSLQNALTAGNTGAGHETLQTLTTGGSNTALGYFAGQAATTGNLGVYIGSSAGKAGNAVTTAGTCTFVGANSGLYTSTQTGGGVAIGYNSKVGGAGNATAIGSGTVAGAAGAVAIGVDNGGAPAITTTANEFLLGTNKHNVRVPGWLQLDRSQTTVGAAGGASALPATPTKYLSVKDSTGTEYVMPVYAKV